MTDAPRITPADIEAAIKTEHYVTGDYAFPEAFAAGSDADKAKLSTVTLCWLTLHNGFTVLGKSAVVSPANFNVADGRKYARENAVDQLWQVMGFALQDRLYREQLDATTAPVVVDPPADAAVPAPAPLTAPTAVTDEHVTAFLQYPLPEDVRPDVVPGAQSYGTHLLSWPQAKAMLEHVFSFGKKAEDPSADTWLDRRRAEQAQLADRVVKLNAFLDGHGAPTDTDEALLRRQASLMDQLDDVLLERIARAKATTPVPDAPAQETQA